MDVRQPLLISPDVLLEEAAEYHSRYLPPSVFPFIPLKPVPHYSTRHASSLVAGIAVHTCAQAAEGDADLVAGVVFFLRTSW